MKSKEKKKISIKWKVPAKWTIFGLTMGVVLATVGSIAALNGWFGGGSSIPEDTMTRGLSGYWSFDEGSGTIAHDASTNQNHQGLANGAGWGAGKIGSGLHLDGADDWTSDSVASDVVGNETTIELWFKLSIAHQNGSGEKFIIYYGGGSGYDEVSVELYSNGTLNVLVGNGASWNSISSDQTSWSAGTWYHMILGYNKSQMKLVINGVIKTADAAAPSIVADQPLYIGRHPSYASSMTWPGVIDEVKIYNRLLSDAEIKYHYNQGGPVAHWKFDEGEGRTVYDSTDNNNDGTLVLAGSATSSAWVSGKYGTALSFDGVDDYVDAGNASALDFATGDFTIEAWILYKGAGSHGYVAGKGNAYNEGYWLFTESDNDACLYITDSGGVKSACASGAVANDKWHHLVGIYSDADNLAKIYVDGEYEGKVSVNSPTGHTDDNFRMGNSETTQYPFKGLIDEVRIYNYARTPEEIRLDYNVGFAALFGPQSSCEDDPGACITEGLIGYWPFDEGSGTIAHDASNYGIHGAASSGWTAGKVGGAASFDGTNDSVETAANENLTFADGSAMAWIKTATGDRAIMFHGDSSSSGGYHFDWGVLSNGKMALYIEHGSGSPSYNLILGAGEVADNSWHFVAFTYNYTTGETIIYLDGKIDASGTARTIMQDTKPLRIGRNWGYVGYYPQYFNGLIDEVRVYNRVLPVAEVRYHYNRGGPVAQWKMDEGNGRTVYDSTENNNDGTLVLAGSATSSAWVSGKYGSALSFDGVDDYVVAASSPNFAFSGDFTIGGWFYLPSLPGTYYVWKSSTTNNALSSVIGPNRFSIGKSNISEDTIVYYTPPVAQWFHLIIIRSGNTVTFYLNGTAIGTGVNTYSFPQGNAIFGVDGNYTSFPFKGLIDDVRIYNYARTPDEIRLDYNAGLAAHIGYTGAGCATDPASCMTEGLVGYWGFEEGNGTVAHDASNYANNGVASSTWATGKVGGAGQFDGVDDFVSINSLAINPATDNTWTISAWVNVTGAGNHTIFSAAYDGNNYIHIFIREVPGTNGRVSWRVAKTGNTERRQRTTQNLVTTNAWHFVTVSKSGNNDVVVYVDGTIDTTREDQGSDSSGNVYNKTYIGRTTTDSVELWYAGRIDEVRVYNRALSAEEIRYHYNKGGPVAQWKMDEGEGRTVYDSTDNNNDGTLVLAGSATTSAWVSGKYGSALSFDGVDDYVSLPSNAKPTGAHTISFWLKPNSWTNATYPSVIGGRGLGSQDSQGGLSFTRAGDGIQYDIYDADSRKDITVPATEVPLSQWSHVVLLWDGSQNSDAMKIFVNGILKASGSAVGITSPLNWNSYSFYLGYGYRNYYQGLIDDVRVYNYARTQEQIRTDYNAGLGAHFK